MRPLPKSTRKLTIAYENIPHRFCIVLSLIYICHCRAKATQKTELNLNICVAR